MKSQLTNERTLVHSDHTIRRIKRWLADPIFAEDYAIFADLDPWSERSALDLNMHLGDYATFLLFVLAEQGYRVEHYK